MTVNEAVWDRVLRVVGGIVLLWLGLGGAVSGTLVIIFAVIGIGLLLTGAVGYCPAYQPFRFSTKRQPAGPVPPAAGEPTASAPPVTETELAPPPPPVS